MMISIQKMKTLTATLLALLSMGITTQALALTVHHHVHGYPDYPSVEYGTGPQAELIKKGEYLVKAGDCIACHTAPKGKPFAGGLAIKTPFGTIYSQNITPDKKTGIGKWTEENFVQTMHEGISPASEYYFPVFPYVDFHKVTTSDLHAIWTYLKKLPAIENENKAPDMPWPFRWRFMQLGWRMLFFQFQKAPFKPDATKSSQWNRGAYLVQGLGHCGMCHTPLNMLGAVKHKYYLQGGFVDGFHAPNISNTALKDVPIEKILKVFKQDRLIEGGHVIGPMAAVNHDSLLYMTDPDLKAIATYIKSVKSTPLPKVEHATTVSVALGKTIYTQHCAACHTTGAGDSPKLGDAQAWAPRIKLGMNMLTKYAIVGIRGMPPKGTCATCSHAEIQSAVEYIVQESQEKTGVQPRKIVKLHTKSLAEGKKVYNRACYVCHNNGELGAPKLGDKSAWKPLLKKNMDVLIRHTLKGFNNMPPKGACNDCSDAQIIAAIKYMAEQGKTDGDYTQW